MSIFSEYTKAPQNDARSEERRYYAENNPNLKNIDGVLNIEGDKIWISAYWHMSEEALGTGMDVDSQRG